ncbi:unnamed protein product [marine sediment metagenome]|uniref:Uncharacterized protein n=1 Tax=marine sediment metagenome TaxID=412755 RepID=X0RZ06_9ZZZZ
MSEENYDKKDLEASLRRAFVDGGFKEILIDGHEARSKFLRDAINHGLNRGWLQVTSQINESQYTAVNYGLTDGGRKYFGLAC